VETLLILSPAVAFAVCVHFGVGFSFQLFRGFVGPTVAICDRSSVSGPDFRANEASYAFMAAIIAGMPTKRPRAMRSRTPGRRPRWQDQGHE
jgi:hypothetical protein